MKDEVKVRRVVLATFTRLESKEQREEFIQAAADLLGSQYVLSFGGLAASETRRAENAEAALAVREAELETIRSDLRHFQNSIDLRTPEDHIKINKYDEAMRQLATFETRVGTEVAARLQEVVEGKDRELADLRRTRAQAEELASQLSQLLIRG